MAHKRMKSLKSLEDEEKAIECQNYFKEKYEEYIRSDFLKYFGHLFCHKTMDIPLLAQEVKTVCHHPESNSMNYTHYEASVNVKNVINWLDAKLNYSNNNNTSRRPPEIPKVSHVVSAENSFTLSLYYEPKIVEEQNSLVCTPKKTSTKKRKIVLNDNENLAIAGPSGNVKKTKRRAKNSTCKPNFSGDPEISINKKSSNFTVQDEKNMYARNSKGETKMHTACAKGKIHLVVDLLVRGFNPNIKDNAGWTPLHEAAKNGYSDIVNILIKYGAFVNVPGFEYETPLHIAMKYNQCEVAVILLERGADINDINLFGDSAQTLNPGKLSKLLKFNEKIPCDLSSILFVHNYKSEQIVVLPVNLTIKSSIVKRFSKKFNIQIAKNILNNGGKASQVTHIIVPKKNSNVCDVNLECLTGIANGLFIVNENWILDALEKEELINCEEYEVYGTTEFPTSKGSINSRIHKTSLRPKLFDGLNVHVSGNIGWKQFTRENIKQLVLEFGAKLLQRLPNPEDSPTNLIPYHFRNSEEMRYVSNIVIYTEDSHRLIKYNMNHLKVFPISWFMEAIQKYSLV